MGAKNRIEFLNIIECAIQNVIEPKMTKCTLYTHTHTEIDKSVGSHRNGDQNVENLDKGEES